MKHTHAIRIHETGGPEVMVWEPVPLEDPGPREVLLRQTAVGLNYIDTYHRSGLYPLPELPAILGREAAGVVEAVGPDVDGLRPGDRVAYPMVAGSYCEARVIDADHLAVLANQEFMFFYYVAAPPAIWMVLTYKGDATRRVFLKVFGLAGLVWFLCIFLQIGMSMLPRYYMLPTVVIAIIFAIWLREVAWRRHPVIAIGLLIFLVSTNAMGIYIDNRNPLYAERGASGFSLAQRGDRSYRSRDGPKRCVFIRDCRGKQSHSCRRAQAGRPLLRQPEICFPRPHGWARRGNEPARKTPKLGALSTTGIMGRGVAKSRGQAPAWLGPGNDGSAPGDTGGDLSSLKQSQFRRCDVSPLIEEPSARKFLNFFYWNSRERGGRQVIVNH